LKTQWNENLEKHEVRSHNKVR